MTIGTGSTWSCCRRTARTPTRSSGSGWLLHEPITRNHRGKSMQELLDLTLARSAGRNPFRVEGSVYPKARAAGSTFPVVGGYLDVVGGYLDIVPLALHHPTHPRPAGSGDLISRDLVASHK